MRLKFLLLMSTLMVLVALAMVFIFVPTEANQGVIQRIFYFHVPVAWVSFLAFFVTFVAGIIYLAKRNLFWDIIASASAEIGLIFTTLVLITGSTWAHSEWNTWWVWDARLTASLVLWLIYVSYFIIRAFIGEDEHRARFAAVVGIIGFIDVPIVALAVQLAPTSHHPGGSIFQGGVKGFMLVTLLFSIAAFTVLYILLMVVGARIKENARELASLKEAMEEENHG